VEKSILWDVVGAHLSCKISPNWSEAADVELVHVVDVSPEHSRPHNAVDTQFEFDLLVERFQQEGVLAHSTLLYGPPERVITEHAQDVNANYIMFGLHHDGHSSSYFARA
jgi:hypothetical protein